MAGWKVGKMSAPEQVRDYLCSPVEPVAFAELSADFNRVNWRPFSPDDAPGWTEFPLGDKFIAAMQGFGDDRRTFYGTMQRTRALGGIFLHQDLLHDYIDIDGQHVTVSDALLRAAAVCKFEFATEFAVFDYADLLLRAGEFGQLAAVEREGQLAA